MVQGNISGGGGVLTIERTALTTYAEQLLAEVLAFDGYAGGNPATGALIEPIRTEATWFKEQAGGGDGGGGGNWDEGARHAEALDRALGNLDKAAVTGMMREYTDKVLRAGMPISGAFKATGRPGG